MEGETEHSTAPHRRSSLKGWAVLPKPPQRSPDISEVENRGGKLRGTQCGWLNRRRSFKRRQLKGSSDGAGLGRAAKTQTVMSRIRSTEFKAKAHAVNTHFPAKGKAVL